MTLHGQARQVLQEARARLTPEYARYFLSRTERASTSDLWLLPERRDGIVYHHLKITDADRTLYPVLEECTRITVWEETDGIHTEAF
jgi:hypothetical protein